jgi:hypothetical protein
MAATEGGLTTTLSSSGAPGRTELVGPGATLADERLLPVLPALQPLLPHPGLRRGATVAAVGLPDLGIVAAAETGIVLERLALVPAPGARAWPTVVAALLDAVDVVLVRSPPGLPDAQARRLIARARERGTVLVPLGPWPQPADLRLAVTASTWHGIGQGHGHLNSRLAEVVATGRGAATRERRTLLWLPSPDGTVTCIREATARVGPGGPAGLALAGEGDAPAGEGRAMGVPAGEGGLPAPAQLPGRSPEAPLADAG